MKLHISGFVVISAIFIYSACRKDSVNQNKYLDKPNCTSSFIHKAHDYQIVGFYPSWAQDALPVSAIPWDKLTRIVFAFATPNTDGTINTGSLINISRLIDDAHSHGVEVYISIGGGGDGSNNFPAMATNEESRNLFIKEVRQYVFEYCLDGVDIDWEYWSGYVNDSAVPAESNALVTLLKDLKKELAPFNLGISIDLGASNWSGKYFYNDITKYVDHFQVMCYDFTGPWSAPGPHSSFADAIGSGNSINSTGLAYWVNYRGWPKEQVLLGVPFYGRDFDDQGGAGIAYSQILALYPNAYLTDQVKNIYYDGIITMAKKAQYVSDSKYSGVMIWEITLDSPVDSTSLLSAINKVLKH